MKLVGWAVSAGLIVAASAASAQMLAPNDTGRSPYRAASDFEQPYPAPPPAPGYSRGPSYGPGPGYDAGPGYGPGYDARPGYDADPGYGPGPGYGRAPDPGYGSSYAPSYRSEIIPPQEVYEVLRESGFSPLGAPHLRGYVYMIAAIDRSGEDGRLIIDARTGRILRFMPASRWGSNGERDMGAAYGAQAALPQPTQIQGWPPRPPALVPHIASRAVPLPVAKPPAAQPAEPPQQSAAVQQPKPSSPPVAAQPSGTVGAAKPAPQIQPTQPMPQAQGLD